MKTTADARRRVTLPKGVRKGDTFEIEPSEGGRFVLVKLEKAKATKCKATIVRRYGHLVFASEKPFTIEETLKAKEDAL